MGVIHHPRILGQTSACIPEAEQERWCGRGRDGVEVGGVNMERGLWMQCWRRWPRTAINPSSLALGDYMPYECMLQSGEANGAFTLLPLNVYIYIHCPWHDGQTLWVQAHLTQQETCFTSKIVWLVVNAKGNDVWKTNKHKVPVSPHCDSGLLGIEPSVMAVLVSCGTS